MVMAAAIVTAVAAVAKTVSSSIEANNQLDQQARLANYQKGIAETNAGNAARASELEGEDARRESRTRLGELRTAFGANGIDMAGSPLDVLQDTAAESELTARRKEYAGEVQAVNFRNQSKMFGYEAAVAKSNKKSGLSIAFNSLVAGGMAFGSTYAAGGGFSGGGAGAGSALSSSGSTFSGAAANTSANNTSMFLAGGQ